MRSEHKLVTDLHPLIQRALRAVNFAKKAIEVSYKETAYISCSGGDGYRGFATIIDLASGKTDHRVGSWGGANMFVKNNTVDNDSPPVVLTPDRVVVTGYTGHKIHASITMMIPQCQIHEDCRTTPELGRACESIRPATPNDLTQVERAALLAMGCKAGAYRQEEMRRGSVTPEVLDGLVARGYLSRNKAGATALTLLGKNAK